MFDTSSSHEQQLAAIKNYLEGLQQIEDESKGDWLLLLLASFVRENLRSIANNLSDFSSQDDYQDQFKHWPELFIENLNQSTNDTDAAEHAVAAQAYLQSALWPKPLNNLDAEKVFDYVNDHLGGTEQSPQSITTHPDFRFSPGLNELVVEAFIEEMPPLVKELTNAIEKLQQSTNLKIDLEHIQRVALNVKGTTSMVGIVGVADMMGQIEIIIDVLLEHDTNPDPGTVRSLTDAADCLEEIIESLVSRTATPENASDIRAALHQTWAEVSNLIRLPVKKDLAQTIEPEKLISASPEPAAEGRNENFHFGNEVSDQIVASFQEEAPQLAAVFSMAVQQLDNSTAGEQNLLQAQRAAHTLKGTAAVVDVAGIADLMHMTEDILEAITDGKLRVTDELKTCLIETADYVEEAVENLLQNNLAPAPADHLVKVLSEFSSKTEPEQSLDDQDLAEINNAVEEQLQDEEIEIITAINSEGEITEPDQSDYALADFQFPNDVHAAITTAFLDEVPTRVEEFSQCIASLSEGEENLKHIVTAQRIAHTIKGSASIAGVKAVSELMHRTEDILEYCANSEHYPEPALQEILVETADCIEDMVDHLLGQKPPPDTAEKVLSGLTFWHQQFSDNVSDLNEQKYKDDDEDDIATEEDDQAALAMEKQSTAVSRSLRVRQSTIDDLLRFAGEISISTVQLGGFQTTIHDRLTALSEQNELVQERMDLLNSLIHIRGVPALKQQMQSGSTAVEIEFDPLELDQYNELHSASNALTETLQDSAEISKTALIDLGRLDELLLLQSRNTKELTNTVLEARLVYVASLEPRLQRMVRQTCRATNKKANLTIIGSQLQIDSEILVSITDALLHMLRNAIDHGIETEQQREQLRKDVTGSIILEFKQSGDLLTVRCTDDGAGFNYDRIKQEAIVQGLVSKDDNPTEDELIQLTWRPGFSTQQETTQVSGRGIGANIIFQQAQQHRGTAHVVSEQNVGTTTTIILPLTVISVQTMLIRVGNQVFGVPSTSMEQVLLTDTGQLQKNAKDDLWEFHFEDSIYEILNMSTLLGIPATPVNLENNPTLPMLLMESGSRKVAILFDQAIDGLQLIVKKLSEYIPRVRGVAGATVLADGTIAAILDLRELIQKDDSIPLFSPTNEQIEVEQEIDQILIVDDSLSARTAMTILVSNAGYEVSTAIDGLDAIDKIEQQKPAAILLDMEMPRMTGVELALHLRADPETVDLPIIMVTSRSMEKHQRQALSAGVNAFVTKPFNEAEILEELGKLI